MAGNIFNKIFDDPSADHGVVGNDQDRDNGIQPPANGKGNGFSKEMKRTYRTFAGHTSKRGFSYDHGVTEGQCQQNIDKQENTAAVFGRKIWKTPYISKTNGGTRRRKDEAELS